jgi:pyruvate formate lyase activating enzyme
MTVGEVIEKGAEDSIFYENSKGGVTFSGGEPTLQFNFLKAVLEESGRRHFNRALETNGYLLWKRLCNGFPNLNSSSLTWNTCTAESMSDPRVLGTV